MPFDAGSRPNMQQQSANDTATKIVHGVTGGHDIEFNAEGVQHLISLLHQVKDKITYAGRDTAAGSWDQSPLDPVAKRYKPKADDFLNTYSRWSKTHVQAVEKTIHLLEKIAADYKTRDDDEARAFNGAQ